MKGKIIMKGLLKYSVIPAYIMSLLLTVLVGVQLVYAQTPGEERGPQAKMPFQIKPDPRVQQRSYHFKEAGEDISYSSSTVTFRNIFVGKRLRHFNKA